MEYLQQLVSLIWQAVLLIWQLVSLPFGFLWQLLFGSKNEELEQPNSVFYLHKTENFRLTESQMKTLNSICDTIFPAIDPGNHSDSWSDSQRKILPISAAKMVLPTRPQTTTTTPQRPTLDGNSTAEQPGSTRFPLQRLRILEVPVISSPSFLRLHTGLSPLSVAKSAIRAATRLQQA